MNKRIVLSAIAFLCYLSVGAQVAVGTKVPNDAAMLHIKSNAKGLLIPTSDKVENIRVDTITGDHATEAVGLLFFNSTEKNFYYWDGTEWRCLSPLVATQTDKGIVDPTVTLSDPYTNIRSTFNGPGATPMGGVIMWYGDTAGNFDPNGLGIGNLEGWALCNGKHNTPDLRGRFVVGYSDSLTINTFDTNYPTTQGGKHVNNYAYLPAYGTLGNIGGESTSRLSEPNLPSHTHTVVDPEHSHTNTFSIDNGGAHTHIVDGVDGGISTSPTGFNYASGGSEHDQNSKSDGSHNHTISGTIQTSSTGITLESTGSGTSFSNTPPYYVLAYIMRIE